MTAMLVLALSSWWWWSSHSICGCGVRIVCWGRVGSLDVRHRKLVKRFRCWVWTTAPREK